MARTKSYTTMWRTPQALEAFDRAAGLWTDDRFWVDARIMNQIKTHRKVARKKLRQSIRLFLHPEDSLPAVQ